MAASKAHTQSKRATSDDQDLDRIRHILIGPQADAWQSKLEAVVKDMNHRLEALEQRMEQQFTATAERIANESADLSTQIGDLGKSATGITEALGNELDQTAGKLAAKIDDVSAAGKAAEQRLIDRLKQELDQLRANKTDSERLAGLMRKLGDEILGRD
ncbi:MAG: hypothetical protein AAF004_14950 [Pseudomonadota bacterium]